MNIEVVVGDIAQQHGIQAVLNSANPNLRMGSGVAGAIHRAAGVELESYCQPLAPLKRGHAVITPGFNLPNQWVIHAVADSFIDNPHADVVLAQAIDAALRLATEYGITSLALPAIGTGVYRCPPELSADYTARALSWHYANGSTLQRVRVCVASDDLKEIFDVAMLRGFAAAEMEPRS